MSPHVPVAAAILLTGCATMGPKLSTIEASAQWAARQVQLAAIDSWTVKGRLGVRTNTRGGVATVIWHRERDTHRIELFGPFGGGRVRISQDATSARLIDARQQRSVGRTAEEVLFARVGWHVPFEAMRYWVVGLPAPGAADAQQLDVLGRLMTLRQAGWEITFDDYRPTRRVELPWRISLKALPGAVHRVTVDGTDLGDRLEVKLRIKEWALAADTARGECHAPEIDTSMTGHQNTPLSLATASPMGGRWGARRPHG